LSKILPYALLSAHAPFQSLDAAQLPEGSFQLHGYPGKQTSFAAPLSFY
jgi:hypothetical protein